MDKVQKLSESGQKDCLTWHVRNYIFSTILGGPRSRWEDNIKMDLRGTGWGGIDWIDLAQDKDQWRALANTIMNL
jgi:hypothetical protein